MADQKAPRQCAGPRQRARKGCGFGGPFGTIRAPAGAPRAWAPAPWSTRILRGAHCAGVEELQPQTRRSRTHLTEEEEEEEIYFFLLVPVSYSAP